MAEKPTKIMVKPLKELVAKKDKPAVMPKVTVRRPQAGAGKKFKY